MRYLTVLLLAAAAFAGDPRLNGRWDITPDSKPPRGLWLELTGADTASPGGKFVTAYNGDMNVIQEISINGDQLMFAFTPTVRPRPGETPRKPDHLVYKARLVGDRLEGTFEVEGRNRPVVKWIGVRAPVIPDKDDGSWKEGKPVRLLDANDLSNWKTDSGVPVRGWEIKSGILATSGRGNNIISDAKFWNFALHMEFKVSEHSNSGVGLRARYEVQILDDYGRPPFTHGAAALYARIPPSENASKPAGEWQSYDIRLVGRQVTIVHNGKKVIDKGEVEGLTAVAIDSHEAEPGPIYLQGDHGSVEFRNIVVTPLITQ